MFPSIPYFATSPYLTETLAVADFFLGFGWLFPAKVKLEIWPDPDGLYLIKGGGPKVWTADRASVRQRKTGRPVRFAITEQTRQAIDNYLSQRVEHRVHTSSLDASEISSGNYLVGKHAVCNHTGAEGIASKCLLQSCSHRRYDC